MRRSYLPVLALFVVAAGCPSQPDLIEGDGASLQIPDGAYSGDPNELGVAIDSNPPVALPGELDAASAIFAFTPHGTQFDAAVQVSLPLNANVAEDTAGLGAHGLIVIDVVDPAWEPIPDVSFNDGVGSFPTTHFSWYVLTIGELDGGDDDDDTTIGDDDDDDTGDDDDDTKGDDDDTKGDDDDSGDDDDDSSDDDDDDTKGDDDDATAGGPWPGDFDGSVDDIESFCDTYDQVDGSLILNGSTITDLTGLECLTIVNGDLQITGTDVVTIVFPSLFQVGGNLTVDGTVHTAIEVQALITVGGTVSIQGENMGVVDLRGLESVTSINLANMPTLSSLENVHVPALVPGQVVLSELPQITELGLSFNATTDVGTLVIDGTGLSELGGLETITALGQLSIVANDSMLSLNPGLAVLDLTESLQVANNALLDDLTGLDSIQTIGGELLIVNNGGLQDIAGLDSVISVGQSVLITNNTNMSALSSSSSLGTVGVDLTITGNTSLAAADAEAWAAGITVGGTTLIQNNGAR